MLEESKKESLVYMIVWRSVFNEMTTLQSFKHVTVEKELFSP